MANITAPVPFIIRTKVDLNLFSDNRYYIRLNIMEPMFLVDI